MNNTKWIYKNNNINNSLTDLDIDKDILNILVNRGLDTREKIEAFLHSGLDNLIDPYNLADMEKSVNRILYAIENKESIWIYGDYDVDGITSTSICYLALKTLGANISYYIPLRDEGYGLNKDALSQIADQGGKVVISVDCGISSIEEANHAKEIGLDLIVTDHHELTTELPPAYCVINPKREDQLYDFKYLAGVGTAFLLLLAIYKKLERTEEVYQYLDIVAIGTVADIVPIVEQNRILVKRGLDLLQKTENIGLKTLLPLIFEDFRAKEYNSYDIGFIIAPIFNAAGRLEDAKMAVELLTTPSATAARILSEKLIKQNNERKDIQQEILDMVEDDIIDRKLNQKHVIVSYRENFHHGVIGIVASKIVDKYYKPVIILEVKPKEGIAVASCRSIEGFNILDGLNSMSELFVKYGGHAGAAGFSIPIENLETFEERINEYAAKLLSEEDYMKPIKIDKDIVFNKVSYEFFQKLEDLKPFGFGNANPIFALKNAGMANVRLIGKDKNHIMLDVVSNNLTVRNCVWFGNGHLFEELQLLKEVDIAFKLKNELYKDKYYTKIFVEDICKATEEKNRLRETFDLYDTNFPLKTLVYSRNPVEKGDELALVVNEDSVYLKKENRVIAFVDDKLAYLLRELKFNYGFNFKTSTLKVEKTESNYHLHLEIERDYSFSTLAFKDGDIFKDIKKFLIGPFAYNSMQKKVLAKFFKEDKNTLLFTSKHRGLKTIYLTLGLYYKLKEKRVLLVSEENLRSNILEANIEVSDQYKDGYDIYLFNNVLPPEGFEKKALVYLEKPISIRGFEEVEDNYELPENIEIIEEFELLNKDPNEVYSKKLPLKEKVDIYKNLDKYKKLYATTDILKLI